MSVPEFGSGPSRCTVLGLFPEMEFQQSDIDLRTGDLLVAFTDGVTEALNSVGEEFGDERLKEDTPCLMPHT